MPYSIEWLETVSCGERMSPEGREIIGLLNSAFENIF